MKEGDIVLTALPQVDGKVKTRPALLLRLLPLPYSDYLICGISSQLHQRIENFDEVIITSDEDYLSSGLSKESLIRLGFLAIAPQNTIAGTIGKISEIRHKKLLQRLSNYLIKNI